MKRLLTKFSIFFVTTFCFAGLAFAEPQLGIAGPNKGSMVAVKKAEPPTPGRLSETVKLSPGQRRLLSGPGEFAIYGPRMPVSRERISKIRDLRLRRSSSGGVESDILREDHKKSGFDIQRSISATRKKLVNDRGFWGEDFWTTAITQSEVSSAVYGNHVVAGWNDFDSYFYGLFNSISNWAFSHDGGKTFTDSWDGLPTYAVPGITETLGDPAVDVGPDGTFYYATLCTWTDATPTNYSAICVYSSLDNGNTFSWWWAGWAIDTNDFLDKELLVVDRNNGKVYVTYTYFDDASPLYTIYSWNVTDNILTVVDSNDDGLQGSIPAVDSNGNFYVAYEKWDAGGNPYIRIRKSTDFGASFGSEVNVYGPFIGAADSWIGGDASAFCGRDAIKGNIRSNEFPSLAIDTRASESGAEKLYIAFNARDSITGDLNIYLTHSTDGGATWDITPIRANPRTAVDTSDKFFPWITVNGKGKVGLVYYDRKKTPGVSGIATNNWWITTYMRRFRQNLTVIGTVKLSPPFPVVVNNDYTAICYMAEYNSISANRQAADNNFYVFWGDNRLGDPDIRSSRIIP